MDGTPRLLNTEQTSIAATVPLSLPYGEEQSSGPIGRAGMLVAILLLAVWLLLGLMFLAILLTQPITFI